MALIGEMQYLTIGGNTYSLPSGGGGTVTSVAVSNATNGGLSVSGSPISSSGTITIGHSNVLAAAQTTQAVYPITIDKNGHISAYGTAVTIPVVPTNVSAFTNDAGYLTSYTETDPVFSASAAAGIASTDITNWNKKSAIWSVSSGYNSDHGWWNLTVDRTALHNITNAPGSDATIGDINFPTGSSTYLTISNPISTQHSNRTLTLPTQTGTLALTSQIPTKVSDLTNDSGFITTETDPVFSASAAAGITSADITSWNNKISDDKTWNGVTLEKDTTYGSNFYVPNFSSTSASSAKLTYVTATPSAGRIPRYDDSSYLYSTTPSANDNSTKVATTAYVDNAVPTKTSDLTNDSLQPKTFWIGSSTTGPTTAIKVVTTITGDFTLAAGNCVRIIFGSANQAGAYLNIDGTGAKTLEGSTYMWQAGETIDVVYNGTSFNLVNKGIASSTYYGVTKLSDSVTSTSQSLAATPKAVKTAYDLAAGKQDVLVSGTNIKTINNQSILGSGDITISTTGNIFIAEYDVTSYNDILSAYNAGKTIVARYPDEDFTTDADFYYLAEANVTYTGEFAFVNTSGQYVSTIIINDSNQWSQSGFFIPSITLNGSGAQSASFYAPTNAGTSGYVLKSNGSGAPSWVTATLTDTKVTNTTATPATTYYLTASTSSTTATGGLSKHASLAAYTTADTATSGYTQLRLGNTTVTSSAGGKEGQIRLYGTTATYYVDLKAGAPSANRTITLPNKTGTIALTSDIPTATSTPTASTIAKFDSAAHMNSADMTSAEVSDFVGNLGYTFNLINMFYPVGSYYETSDTSFNPNITWSGTWVLETEGQVHVSAGENYEVGDTGGEATHTLTVNEMPVHGHNTTAWVNAGTTATSKNWTNYGATLQNAPCGNQLANGTWKSTTFVSAQNGHGDPTGIAEASGNGQAHENMQPYIVVNRWHRTA